MKVKLSRTCFRKKPTGEDYKKLMAELKYNNSEEVTLMQLATYLEYGRACVLAEFKKDCKSVNEQDITSIQLIALDIDSKEHKITLDEFKYMLYKDLGIFPAIEYCTFSDVDRTKFRLIYAFETPIDSETYKMFYGYMSWKYKKYIDSQTKNPNRMWQGTNKEVVVTSNFVPVSTKLLMSCIKEYQRKIQRDKAKKERELRKKFQNCKSESSGDYDGEMYIASEYKKDVQEILYESISLKEYFEKHFGVRFEVKGNYLHSCCPLHDGGGDNKTALHVTDTTGRHFYHCHTHGCKGNLITLARVVQGEDNFSAVALKLANEYNILIPSHMIRGGRKNA